MTIYLSGRALHGRTGMQMENLRFRQMKLLSQWSLEFIPNTCSEFCHSVSQIPSSSTFWKLPWRLSGLIMFLCCFDVISVTAAIICHVGQEPKRVWTSERREPGCEHGTVQSHIIQKPWEYFSHSHFSQIYWFLYQVLPVPMWGISYPWNVIKR